MKIFSKFILVAILTLSATFSFANISKAETTPIDGFYVDNKLDLTLTDFAKMSKKDIKPAFKKYFKKGTLVMDGKAYNFLQAALAPDEAAFNKVGIPVAEYEAKNGKLQSTPTEVDKPFEILSID